jgi:chemotaxis protein methyltransferase CheR
MTRQQGAAAFDAKARFRGAVHRLTGISLPETKAPMIEQRLRRRVVATGQASTEDYLNELMAGRLGPQEMQLVIDLITTNTTSFFRERAHFDYLSDVLLPKMVRARNLPCPRLKFWSAASSEGAEVYTLAMVLAEARRTGLAFDWAILGTDISTSMVEKARTGVYAAEQTERIETELKNRYIMNSVDPSTQDLVRIVPELRVKVRFGQLNLMEATYPVDRDIDVIFLRNVLIYFDATDRVEVVRRLQGHLRPGGYLIVGHSEGMSVSVPGMERVRPTIFRKAAA